MNTSQKMFDDDIVVIEEHSNKRLQESVLPNSLLAKKPKTESFAKPNCEAGRTSLVQLKLFNELPSLLLEGTEKMFVTYLNGVSSSMNREGVSKRFAALKGRIDKCMHRANFLINYPKQPNAALYRRPNGFQMNHNTYLKQHQQQLQHHHQHQQQHQQPHSFNIAPPVLQPAKEPTSQIDGLQVVCTIAGKSERNLPPPGYIKRPELQINDKVFVMKTDLFGIWVRGVILSIKDGPDKNYRIKVETNNHKPVFKICTSKQMAYEKPADVRLPFGRRIIALYKPEDKNIKPVMYAGVIAEPPKSTNRYRYLVFFDDGFAQYTEHDGVRLVCEESKNVWDDIHPDSKDFIKSYCEQFPERPMLKLQKNQVIKTEYNSGWWFAKVVDVDASMVKMYFEAEKRYEWIYRGSTRLAPLFNELEKAKYNRLTGKVRRHNITRRIDENQPYVEYTRTTYDEIVLDDSEGSDTEKKVEKKKNKNTARKSTTQVKKPVLDEPPSEVRNDEGEVYSITLPKRKKIQYVKHTCSVKCRETGDVSTHHGENPLRIPMLMGWERHFKKYRQRGLSTVIHYRTPCGKTLRNISEVNFYLNIVSSQLTVDLFTFDPLLAPFQSFRTNKDETLWSTSDITGGKEPVPIECVNCLTNEKPPYVEYATERFPGKGVNLNLDENFLSGCTCTDNCQDALKCQCRQLTIKAFSKDGAQSDVGYNFKRLTEPIVTGIYECNSRCGCGPSCMNRVVQNGLKIRLQMFKTAKKGWGIRCLDDVDAGMFLCIYAGQLLTEQGADEDGHRFGDEYLAELDHIEVAEKMKEGYESDVPIDIDVEVKSKEETGAKESTESDVESDVSSLKSNSSSVRSAGEYSDPEFEVKLPHSHGTSSYSTRSKNRTKVKKNFTLFTKSEDANDSDDSSMGTSSGKGSKMDVEKGELPDLNDDVSYDTLVPRPLSPKTIQSLEDIHISRKPKVETLVDNGSVNSEKKSINTKKSQSLSKQPLPPPMPIESNKYVSVRTFFQEDYCYIMDAKSKGNIGRYLNHSCSPNSFVQNVFVDTHDLRFPTVAFFASDRIKAGTELTWDYNYEVGSVEEKILYCHCESKNCRGRLL